MTLWGTSDDGKPIFESKLDCPECTAPMRLRRTEKYRWRNGQGRLFYGCSRWPKCSATHGAHPDGRPLGTPANRETKKMRRAAHEQFDAMVLERRWRLSGAYRWLGRKLGIPELQIAEKCHIGMFDIDTCRKVVAICRRARDEDRKSRDQGIDLEESSYHDYLQEVKSQLRKD